MRQIGFIVAALSCAASAEAQPAATIVSNIERSEWTPALRLELDLNDGHYAIDPPSGPWPEGYEKPQRRRGTLPAEALKGIRTVFDDAFANGVAIPACVAANGRGYPLYISNGGIYEMSLTLGDKTISTYPLLGCWTPVAGKLYHMLDQAFSRWAR
jgi:hypothetical protein